MPGAEAVYRFRIILSGAAGVGRQLFVLSVLGKRKMDQEYCIVKAYREDTDLRRSFNRLAGEIFGLDFEDWYQGATGETAIFPIRL